MAISSSATNPHASAAHEKVPIRPADLIGDARERMPDELNAAQRRIRQLEEQVAVLQRTCMMGTLAFMVAHEFNNLMTPVLTRAQLALDTGTEPLIRKALDAAVVNAQKAIGITAHLLDIARNDQDAVLTCPVEAAVQRAIDIVPRMRDRDMAVRVEVPADLVAAARPLLFEQVLLNLVLNARAALQSRNGSISIQARREGRTVVLEISDTGVGMPAEHIDRVLNPFLASDPLHDALDWRAVGLGLNVCRTLAAQHGATLRARLNDGPGCTFELRWPAA